MPHALVTEHRSNSADAFPAYLRTRDVRGGQPHFHKCREKLFPECHLYSGFLTFSQTRKNALKALIACAPSFTRPNDHII